MNRNLSQRLPEFAINVIKLSEQLDQNFEKKSIKIQLIRAATSVGANYQESQFGCSKADFINKLYIALKELAETKYWLIVIRGIFQHKQENVNLVIPLLSECEELIKILSSCILTAKQNQKRTKS